MEILSRHEAVVEMLRLMEENGRQNQAKEMSRLVMCVFKMEVGYEALLKAQDTVPKAIGETISTSSTQAREKSLTELGDQIQTVQGKIIVCAERAAKDFDQKGVPALDAAVSAIGVGIKGLLESMRKKVSQLRTNARNPLLDFNDTLLVPIGSDISKACGALDRLGRCVEYSRSSSKKPSIIQRLRNKAAPDRSIPKAVGKSHEAER